MAQNLRKTPIILITGSTSFVCRYLVASLLSQTDFNIVLTYKDKKGSYEDNSRLFFEKYDLLKPESFDTIIAHYKPKHIVHLAAMARLWEGEKYPNKVIRANVIGSIVLAKLAIKYKAESMIFTSSNLAQDAVSVVGTGKLLLEQYFQKSDSQTTRLISLRMPNVIDSNGSVTLIFKRQIENDQPITVTHPDMSRMFVTGENSAKLLYYLINHGINKGVYVSYEKPLKITDLAENMIKASGKDIKIKYTGIKPGEKLSEKSFTSDEIIKTDIDGLGMIADYKFEKDRSIQAINFLNKTKEIRLDKDIQNIFAELC
jgi:FlaA1/EpsC-like NDP-sugar epimerase